MNMFSAKGKVNPQNQVVCTILFATTPAIGFLGKYPDIHPTHGFHFFHVQTGFRNFSRAGGGHGFLVGNNENRREKRFFKAVHGISQATSEKAVSLTARGSSGLWIHAHESVLQRAGLG